MSEELQSGWYMPAPPTAIVFGWPPRAYFPFIPPGLTPYPQPPYPRPPAVLAPPAPIPQRRESRDGSSSTIELPRTYPPPYFVHYPHDDKPIAPLQKVPIPVAPLPNPTFGAAASIPSPPRQDLDGHTYSSDTHYRRVSAKEGPSERKPEVFVKFHYCARCGRHRSKRYHREHPLMPRSTPVSGICRRCIPPDAHGGDAKEVHDRESGRTEVQEVLIHRRQDSPLAKRCRSPIETIRITRRYLSSSPKPSKNATRQLRHSRSSESLIKVKKHKEDNGEARGRSVKQDLKSSTDGDDSSKENATGPSKAPPSEAPEQVTRKYPKHGPKKIPKESPKGASEEIPEQPQGPAPALPVAKEPSEVRGRVGSQSTARYETLKKQPAGKPSGHRDIDRIIASHPNAWGHGHLTTVKDPMEQAKPRREEAANLPRPPSPPEWYYRHVSREFLPRTFTVRRYRISDAPEEPRVLHRPSPEFQPGQGRGILQNSVPKMPRDTYQAEQERFPDYDMPGYKPAPHVKFARGADGQKTARREQEAARDWEEEKQDQKEFEDTKRHLRRSVRKGGGPYEVDGHYSEESRQPDVSEDEVRNCYRNIPAPYHTNDALVLRDAFPRRKSATGGVSIDSRSVPSLIPARQAPSINASPASRRGNYTGPAATLTAISVMADTIVLRHSTTPSRRQGSPSPEHLAGSVRSVSSERSLSTAELEGVYAMDSETKQSDGAWEADVHLAITEEDKPWEQDVTSAEPQAWELDERAEDWEKQSVTGGHGGW